MDINITTDFSSNINGMVSYLLAKKTTGQMIYMLELAYNSLVHELLNSM